jgi:transposase InsO family protein
MSDQRPTRDSKSLEEATVSNMWEIAALVERWRQTYNRIRPHSALGYRPPAPETIMPQCI